MLPDTLTALSWASLVANLVLGALTITFGLLFLLERREARESRNELSSFLKAYASLGQVVKVDGRQGKIVKRDQGEYADEWTIQYGVDVILTRDKVETRKTSENEEE